MSNPFYFSLSLQMKIYGFMDMLFYCFFNVNIIKI